LIICLLDTHFCFDDVEPNEVSFQYCRKLSIFLGTILVKAKYASYLSDYLGIIHTILEQTANGSTLEFELEHIGIVEDLWFISLLLFIFSVVFPCQYGQYLAIIYNWHHNAFVNAKKVCDTASINTWKRILMIE